MQAQVGERILIHGKQVGQPEHGGEIREIRGDDGAPPYFVHFDDGHDALVFPGPDCVIEHTRTR
jgi:hypothetical protein